jgi:small-conductance mechanosensitive channel
LKPIQWLGVALLTTCLIVGLASFSVNAQDSAGQNNKKADALETANVVVDGRPIFEVTTVDNDSAEERAEMINESLADLVQDSTPERLNVQVADQGNGQSAVISINNDYLFTVTAADARNSALAANAEQVAQQWSNEIEQAIRLAREERSQEFLLQALALTFAALMVAIALHWLVQRLFQQVIRPALRQLVSSDEPDEDGDATRLPKELNISLNLLMFLIRSGLWISTVLYITNLFPLTRQWSYRVTSILLTSLAADNLTLGQQEFSVLDFLLLIVQLVALIIGAGALTNFLQRRILSHIVGINRGVREAVAIVIKYGFIALGAIVLLQLWGIDFSSLALLASALGVGIGFGFQDIAKNFGSGLVLVFERPIQIGDFIQIGDSMGTVERIGARSTEIKTLDQVSVIVPNSHLLEQEVTNWSHRNPISRLRVPVGVAYSSDPAVVRDILMEAGRNHPNTLATPAPNVFFTEFGDSSLNFELLVWIAEPAKQIQIRSDLYFQIERMLRQHDIEIPFPQRDLHVRSGSLPVDLPPELKHWLHQQSRSNSANANHHSGYGSS